VEGWLVERASQNKPRLALTRFAHVAGLRTRWLRSWRSRDIFEVLVTKTSNPWVLRIYIITWVLRINDGNLT
jgi:hypothetical protein